MKISNKKKCILCSLKMVKSMINFGNTPLANNLIKNLKNKKQKKYPLVLGKCMSCEHIQLSYLPNPKLMFKNYLYLSSASSTLTNHLKKIPLDLNKIISLKKMIL